LRWYRRGGDLRLWPVFDGWIEPVLCLPYRLRLPIRIDTNQVRRWKLFCRW